LLAAPIGASLGLGFALLTKPRRCHTGGMSKRDLQRSLQGNVDWKRQLVGAFDFVEDTHQLVRTTQRAESGMGRPSIWLYLPEIAKQHGWEPED
jgi:hypothetical protein